MQDSQNRKRDEGNNCKLFAKGKKLTKHWTCCFIHYAKTAAKKFPFCWTRCLVYVTDVVLLTSVTDFARCLRNCAKLRLTFQNARIRNKFC